jgi:hypothetical protein
VARSPPWASDLRGKVDFWTYTCIINRNDTRGEERWQRQRAAA